MLKPSMSEMSMVSKLLSPVRVNSARVAGGLPHAVHCSAPPQSPVWHEPLPLASKLQFVRPHIRAIRVPPGTSIVQLWLWSSCLPPPTGVAAAQTLPDWAKNGTVAWAKTIVLLCSAIFAIFQFGLFGTWTLMRPEETKWINLQGAKSSEIPVTDGNRNSVAGSSCEVVASRARNLKEPWVSLAGFDTVPAVASEEIAHRPLSDRVFAVGEVQRHVESVDERRADIVTETLWGLCSNECCLPLGVKFGVGSCVLGGLPQAGAPCQRCSLLAITQVRPLVLA
nr:hypothetical protein KK1_011842 [Ipomoea batatas]